MEAIAGQDRVKNLNRWAAILFALAMLGPWASHLLGFSDAYSIGMNIGTILGRTGFIALVAWLIARKSGDAEKANARMIVCLLACVVSGFVVVKTAREHEQAKSALRNALEYQQRDDMTFAEFFGRYEANTVTNHILPEVLVSPQRLEEAKRELQEYRALLDERKALIKKHVDGYPSIYAHLPSGKVKADFEKASGPRMEAVRTMYATLDHVESEYADVIHELFEWATVNRGQLSIQDGLIEASDKQQERVFIELLIRFKTTSAKVEQAKAEVLAKEEAQLENQERSKETVKELLER